MTEKRSKTEIYQAKINRVYDFLHQHRFQSYSLNQLSQIANISPFHFHRIFKALSGETIGEYIIRLKLEAACKLLKHTKNNISQIAYDVGFETPAGLSKAFKKRYNISPTKFRISNSIYETLPPINKEYLDIHEPVILDLKEQIVAYSRYIGSYQNIDYADSFNKLEEFFTENNLWCDNCYQIGICYDDPDITAEQLCRYDICMSTDKTFAPNNSIGKMIIPAGKFAVFTHCGSLSDIEKTYNTIYGKWLLNSPYEVRDSLTYDKFIDNIPDVTNRHIKTEIYIPIHLAD
ncbi:MAG: AraC family transcriptional regulator [Bacteroidales bacterium]|jgi:AraC family transcriptional regulator|nr:AraC family transcriptional regulator [Bacteroidales bacterium]